MLMSWHITILIYTILHNIIAPVLCSVLVVLNKYEDKTLEATYYLAFLAVLLISKDEVMDIFEKSHKKIYDLSTSEYPEEKE
jgi:hypothetical protein